MISDENWKKLTEIESKLQDWPFPRQIIIETTAFCNFRCSHCNHKDMVRHKGSMEDAVFKKIVDEIVAIDPETEIWPTFYGEAFVLGKKLFDRLAYLQEAGAKNVVLNSNGSLLNHADWTDRILRSGLRRFILSLDGFSKETFERIRAGGDREEIFTAVEKLLARRRELGITYPVIQCQFSLMDENRHEFPAFKKHWESHGAEVKSRNMLSWTNSGPVVAGNLDYHSQRRIACPWSNNTMAIHYNGDIVACAVDYEGGFKAGNIKNNTLKEIWDGPLKTLMRAPHREHRWKDIPELCKKCPDWQAVGATYHEDEKPAPDKTPAYSRPFWHKDKATPTS